MQPTTPFLGEALSILTAVVWAFAVTLFRKSGETVHPLALNTFKNLLAITLLVPTILLLGQPLILRLDITIYAALLLSGAIGIGVGDTLFFKSLNDLGAGLTGIVVCLYSPFIIAFSYLWLNENLSPLQLTGVLLIITAVLIVTIQRKAPSVSGVKIASGVVFGVLASAAMAIGVVLMKPLLDTYAVVWVAAVRLIGGMVILIIVLLISPKRSSIMGSLFTTHNRYYTVAGSFFGAYVSMVLWIAGIKYTQASIASALNQTSTIFIFIFAGLILKEPMNMRRTIGIIMAFAGALLVCLW